MTDFVNDTDKLLKNKISWRDFCKTYGHLRSGTYDIESIRYDRSNYFDIARLKSQKKNKNLQNLN